MMLFLRKKKTSCGQVLFMQLLMMKIIIIFRSDALKTQCEKFPRNIRKQQDKLSVFCI